MLIYVNRDKSEMIKSQFVLSDSFIVPRYISISSQHLSLLLSSFLPHFSYTVPFSVFSNCTVYKMYTFLAYMLSHVNVLVYTYSTHVSAHARRNVIGLPPGALCKFAHACSYRRWPSIRFRARLCTSTFPPTDSEEGLSSVPVRRNTTVRNTYRTLHEHRIPMFVPSLEKSPFITAPLVFLRRSDSRDFRSTYEFEVGAFIGQPVYPRGIGWSVVIEMNFC